MTRATGNKRRIQHHGKRLSTVLPTFEVTLLTNIYSRLSILDRFFLYLQYFPTYDFDNSKKTIKKSVSYFVIYRCWAITHTEYDINKLGLGWDTTSLQGTLPLQY